MKPSLAAFTLLAAMAATSAQARIVVDDSAPDSNIDKPGISVPGPGGDSGGKSTEAQQLDSLLFLNKDQLHGTLVGIDAAGVHWKSPESSAPIVFSPDHVSDVKFGARPDAGHTSAQSIALTNHDVLPGNIVSLDDKTLTLDTWYAGRISVPRAMVRGITPNSAGGSDLYEGPTGMEGWTVGNMGGGRAWSFRNGALIGSNYGTIGRDMKLPDMSMIAFDADLRGNGQLSVSIYSDRADTFGNCYMLQFNPNFAELQRYSRNGGSNDMGGGIPLRNTMRRDKMHIELRTDKSKKSIWLSIDGKAIKDWTDTADFNGGGGCLLFACQPGSYVRISNIKVSAWDGALESGGASEEKSDQDTVKLANQDKVSGHLKGIQDGKIKFASDYASLEIPLDRVQQVQLAAGDADAPKPNPGDVHVTLPGDGSVTMKLLNWDSKACKGSSPNFGEASFSPAAFTRIQFNLGAQPQGDEPDDLSPDNGQPAQPEE